MNDLSIVWGLTVGRVRSIEACRQESAPRWSTTAAKIPCRQKTLRQQDAPIVPDPKVLFLIAQGLVLGLAELAAIRAPEQ